MCPVADTIVIRLASDSWISTLIPALAAIGGALVGGVVTGKLSLRGEDKRQTFAREAEERREARAQAVRQASLLGSIRVMRIDFREARSTLYNVLKTGAWWPQELVLAPKIAAENLLELAASLPAATGRLSSTP